VWEADDYTAAEIYLKRHSQPVEECLIWQHANQTLSETYGAADYHGIKFSHQLAYCVKSKSTKWDDDLEVRHLCGNAACVNTNHVELGTGKQNSTDRIEHGTSGHGQNSKINLEVARQIKFSKDKDTLQQRADQFKVNLSTVKAIDAGMAWNWVGPVESADDKTIHSIKTSKREDPALFTHRDYTRKLQTLKRNCELVSCAPVNSSDHHWIWKGTVNNLYGHSSMKGNTTTTHRIAYMCSIERWLPSIDYVRHRCTEKLCCNPAHLEIGTPQQNADDKNRDGTMPKGEKHHNAKITQAIADAIRATLGQGTKAERATRFGVTRATISHIDNGSSWVPDGQQRYVLPKKKRRVAALASAAASASDTTTTLDPSQPIDNCNETSDISVDPSLPNPKKAKTFTMSSPATSFVLSPTQE